MSIFDRKDATRVKLPALVQCMIDLKPRRDQNEVYINQKFDVTNLVKFMNEKKKQGYEYTYFHAFLTIIAKTIYNRPKLNYFIANRHMYKHNNVSIGFVAKIAFTDTSEEVMLIQDIAENDNLDSIATTLKERIEKIRKKKEIKKEKKNGADSAIDKLSTLPNFIRVPIFKIIKVLDSHGLIPLSLSKDTIYYCSSIVTNLGSIKCGSIYHNIADFGSASSLIAIGEIKPEITIDENNNQVIRPFCEIGITIDERIGDGFYFAKSCQLIQHIFDHPELLEEPVNTKIEY